MFWCQNVDPAFRSEVRLNLTSEIYIGHWITSFFAHRIFLGISPKLISLQPGRTAWKNVFHVTAVVMTAGSLVFALFAKGEELEWARAQRQTAPCSLPQEENDRSDTRGNYEDRCDNNTIHAID